MRCLAAAAPPAAASSPARTILGLVRLGRLGAAREALGPFADGSERGYRQGEAQDMIQRLDRAQVGVDPGK
jgi:hypothetical protein